MIAPGATALGLPIFQYAFVVDDLDAAAARWTALFGAGPFFTERHHVMPPGCFHHRGTDVQCDVSYAFGYCGPVQIQLTCQYDDKPSIFREMFPDGAQGFHHVGVLTENFARDFEYLKGLGLEAAVEMAHPGLAHPAPVYRVAYFDARPLIGCFIELYMASPGPLEMFRHWREAHESWDGRTDPIRTSSLPGPRA